MQPGDTITPNSNSNDETVELKIPREPETSPSPTPQVAAQVTPSDPEPSPAPSPEPAADNNQPTERESWQYTPEPDTQAYGRPATGEPVSWTASEFVDHEKPTSWYTGLAFITGVVVAIIYLITRDVITSVVIVIAAILFGITAKRKPRTLQYRLDQAGIHIAEKLYAYADFKSFSVLEEGAFNSIQLMPLKRFMPSISLYYPHENEDQVVEMLGTYLPYQDATHDAIDRLMRRVRF